MEDFKELSKTKFVLKLEYLISGLICHLKISLLIKFPNLLFLIDDMKFGG